MYLTELHINVQKVTLSILLGVCFAKFLEHASIFIHVCGDEGFWSLGLLYPGVVRRGGAVYVWSNICVYIITTCAAVLAGDY